MRSFILLLKLALTAAVLVPTYWTVRNIRSDRGDLVGQVLTLKPLSAHADSSKLNEIFRGYIGGGERRTTAAEVAEALRSRGFEVVPEAISDSSWLKAECRRCTEGLVGRYRETPLLGRRSIEVRVGLRQDRVRYLRAERLVRTTLF